jgi:putative DNA primase/helicase
MLKNLTKTSIMTKIQLKHDMELDIATAHSRLTKRWHNTHTMFSSIVNRCAETTRTGETAAEYQGMSREEQSSVKDVGGFVGGYLREGMRKNGCVLYRSMATLDLDFATTDVWDDFTLNYNCAALLYSTHKHTAEKPRYRIVIPFNRQVTPEEYEPVCRRLAEWIGLDMLDETTYELPRLFYWPSTSKNAPYEFHYQDGEAVNVDDVLATYHDYRDVSEWPASGRERDMVKHEIKKAGDPTEKNGLIGAFCRAYSIEDAIDTFLQDKYEPTAMEGRYTYKLGSVAGGLVCYEGKFAYSHHETDPASRQLCNAFDLVRIHLYGVMDEGSRVTDVTRLPSYQKMQDFVAKDNKVRLLMFQERNKSLDDDFGGIELGTSADMADEVKDDGKWIAMLDADKRGFKSTTENIVTILENDPNFKGHLYHDEFSGFDMIVGGLPWDKGAKRWKDRDEANLRAYIEKRYGITGKDKVKDAKEVILTKHKKHPIKDYFNSLSWDGKPRLDKLIIDYVGAEDTPLNRAVTRKNFVAAVARVFHPGCKYDYCLIIQGKEGIGKSTLFRMMGGEWFNDSLITTEGKTGAESLRGSLIIELSELSSIRRSDVEQIKSYISRQDDIYRAAYGTNVESHPRQCVFCGTTNETYFLKGDTGNRRFWVIAADESLHTKSLADLPKERDEIWAEAVQRYRDGEPLFLPADLEAEARKMQKDYGDTNDDPIPGMLDSFLEMLLPADWSSWDLQRRRAYINNPDPLDEVGTVKRDRMCAAEFICEKMGRNMTDKEYIYISRKVCMLMDNVAGWERMSTTRHAEKLYGIQKGFRRVKDENEDDDEL